MRIEALRLKNFRSFRDEQTLVFGRCNMVVGKNGSGKSNILKAIESAFCFQNNGSRPQYNGNDDESLVEVTVANVGGLAGLPARFTIMVRHRENPEYFFDGKPVSRAFVETLSERIGLRCGTFVRQGGITSIGEMDSAELYRFILDGIGISAYDRRRDEARKLLEYGDAAAIDDVLGKIRQRISELEASRRRLVEYDRLKEKQGSIEYDLLLWDLHDLTAEIEKISSSEPPKYAEMKNEALLEYELDECRGRLCELLREKAELERRMSVYTSVTAERAALARQKTEKTESLQKLREARMRAQTELEAIKYFRAMGTKPEPVEVLERRLESVKGQLSRPAGTRNLEPAIREKKELWLRERQLKEEIENLENRTRKLTEKLLCMGHESVAVYESIKDEAGVLGPLYSLVSVPEELSDAFEAVAKSRMFWIVVETEETALRLVEQADGLVTFVALDRMVAKDKGVIEDPQLVKLSRAVRSEARIRPLLEYICRDFYVCGDLKLGVSLSERYNANIVTVDGDVVTRSGMITGGYEQPTHITRDLRACREEKARKEAELREVRAQLESVTRLSEEIEDNAASDSIEISFEAVAKALSWKISLVRDRRIQLRDEGTILSELRALDGKICLLSAELKAIEREMSPEELVRAEESERLQGRLRMIREEIERLEKEENRLLDVMYASNVTPSCFEDIGIQRKHILLEKRRQLLHKLGKADAGQEVPQRSRESLLQELKALTVSMRGYAGCERAARFAGEGRELERRFEELHDSKQRVLEFIEEIEGRKSAAMAESFELISSSFAKNFERICGNSAELFFRDGGVDIQICRDTVDPRSLSGGQKTAVALCILFAIHSVSPSPFYVFDEIDANLDIRFLGSVYEIISETANSQFFLVSFREEALFCADRFFGVLSNERVSSVAEIDRELARETVSVLSVNVPSE